LRRSTVLMWLMLMGLLISDSRGPWIGAALAFAIASIGRARHAARTAVIVGLLAIFIGAFSYQYIDEYTSATVPQSRDQESAIYRRQLLDAYGPIAAVGGLFGWGPRFPRVPGQPSVDNYYLLTEVTQGSVGLWTFLLVSAEAILSLFLFARKSLRRTEFSFAITMMAMLAGSMLTLTSNGLMYQILELYFLCVGWALSVKQLRVAGVRELDHVAPVLETRKILT
jgi:hypothetical protein